MVALKKFICVKLTKKKWFILRNIEESQLILPQEGQKACLEDTNK